jgi:hypothetical protein
LLDHLVEADRLYAQQEWTALHMSWLASLRAPVLNLPVVQGLGGAWRHPSEWAWLAAQAGLDTGVYAQGAPAPAPAMPTTSAGGLQPIVSTVIAIDGRGINAHVSEDVADACGRLGVLARTRVLGVDLDARTGRFIAASPQPDLRAGGEVLIDALAAALGGAA